LVGRGQAQSKQAHRLANRRSFSECVMHPLMLLETAYFFGSHGDAARCSLKYDVYVMYLLRSSFVPEM
jgi:hypothetical protein